MARCECGAILPGHDCIHCPPTKTWICPKCKRNHVIYNEAHLEANRIADNSVGITPTKEYSVKMKFKVI